MTVLSRCQRYDFRRIAGDTITKRLSQMAQAEKIPADEKALRYIARKGDGSMRDAISLFDQCAAFYYGETLTYEKVLDVLGAVDNEVFSRLLRAVAARDTAGSIRMVEELVLQGRELSQFVLDFTWYMRNLLLLETAEGGEELFDMTSEDMNRLREEASLVDSADLTRYIRIFSELSGQMRYAAGKRVLLELAVIRLTKPQMEENLDSLLQRVKELERRLEGGDFAAPAQSTPAPAKQDEKAEEKERVVPLPEPSSRTLS